MSIPYQHCKILPQIKAASVFIASHSHTYVMWYAIKLIWGRIWGLGISLANCLKSSRYVQISLVCFQALERYIRLVSSSPDEGLPTFSTSAFAIRVKISHISSSSLYPLSSIMCWNIASLLTALVTCGLLHLASAFPTGDVKQWKRHSINMDVENSKNHP